MLEGGNSGGCAAQAEHQLAHAVSTTIWVTMSTKSATRKTRVLMTSQALLAEFRRCCEEYPSVHVSVAWCSDPRNAPVFKLLEGFGERLTATVGVAFCHTHPDAIQWLRDEGADVRVFRGEDILFHPKVYLFTGGEQYAAFIGSSNLTRGGFHENAEVNTLIEGKFQPNKAKDILELQRALDQWHSAGQSFPPTDAWLDDYRRQYERAATSAASVKVRTPPIREEAAPVVGWFGTADWPAYYHRILEGLRQNGRTAQEYHEVLDAARDELSVPWAVGYFASPMKRKIMGGIKEYGWLGHVGAAGTLRGLLANGPPQSKQAIVTAINRSAGLEHPVDWDVLKAELDRLIHLNFTMKVWGRFLCLVRPDLYCTVASDSVRANLSKTLGVSQTAFINPAGYIRLLQLAHASPWFLSGRPSDPAEAAVWDRRMAFMDPIFY
jgi:PLD-like domain